MTNKAVKVFVYISVDHLWSIKSVAKKCDLTATMCNQDVMFTVVNCM